MRYKQQLIVFIIFYILNTSLMAGEDKAHPIPSFTAIYHASTAGLHVGELIISYQFDPKTQTYVYQREAYPTGLAALFVSTKIKESSHGIIQNDRARPNEYIYERSNKQHKNRHIIFKYNKETIDITNIKSNESINAALGTTDNLVTTLNMMFDLNAGIEELSYTFTQRGKIKTYPFTREQEEIISTDNSSYQTLRIRRIRENSKRNTLLWCAPELFYLPIKIEEHKEDGSIERFLLKEFHLTQED